MYAMGYTFNNGLKLQKTGILVIESTPNNAKIYLNGDLQQDFIKKIYKKDDYKTTPQKIKNLTPGEYNIRLELDGYWPWEKKLAIWPGQSTFAEDVKLFKRDAPVLLLKGEKNISISNNQLSIFSWNKKEADLITLASGDIKNINLAASTLPENQEINWSPNSGKILLGDFLFDENYKITNLKNNTDKQAKNFQWDNYSNEYIYYTDNKGLSKYYTADKSTSRTIEAANIGNFFAKRDTIYFLSNEKESTTLNIFNIQDKKIINRINLPLSDYSFINKNHDLLNLFDNKYNILYLLDVDSSFKQLKESLSNISKKTHWINDTQLVYANDFEIWMYDLESSRKKLITRISKKINNIFWLPTNGHILFSTDTTINAIELDDREKYNITKLFESEQIKNPILSKTGDILYFYAIIGGEKGVYKLSID